MPFSIFSFGVSKRNELCPNGYVFLFNITYRQHNGYNNEYGYYLNSIAEFRKAYQDIYVGDAFGILGNKLPNALSIYVKKKPRRFKANRIRKYMKQS